MLFELYSIYLFDLCLQQGFTTVKHLAIFPECNHFNLTIQITYIELALQILWNNMAALQSERSTSQKIPKVSSFKHFQSRQTTYSVFLGAQNGGNVLNRCS